MFLGNILTVLSRPRYFMAFLATTVLVGLLYMGLLTDPKLYDVVGWAFAYNFPPLFGLVVAVQWYNLAERRSCPASASGGGALGGIAGLITASCPVCPSVLLYLMGLGGVATAGVFGGPWVKLGSLVVLMWSLYRATRGLE